VLAEVTNLGVTPLTTVQLRSFTFDGYWTRSSVFENPTNLDELMPLAPGDTAALRFAHDEAGALFDCDAWEGPAETDVQLRFAAGDVALDIPAAGNVRCRTID
jgi:hypothetical protein